MVGFPYLEKCRPSPGGSNAIDDFSEETRAQSPAASRMGNRDVFQFPLVGDGACDEERLKLPVIFKSKGNSTR